MFTLHKCSTHGCRNKVIGLVNLRVESCRWHPTWFCKKHVPDTIQMVNNLIDYVKIG